MKILSAMLLSVAVVATAVPALAATTPPTPPVSASQSNRAGTMSRWNGMSGGGMMGGRMMSYRGGQSGIMGPMMVMMRMMATVRGTSNRAGSMPGYSMMGRPPARPTGPQSQSH